MSVDLSFMDVSYPGFFEEFSCEIKAGCSALIVTSREAESTVLSRLISGLSYPSNGSVFIGSQEVQRLKTDQLYSLRQQMGVVPSNSGLVSNLKVWENITLPLIYHSGKVTPDDEDRALAYLTALGYSGNVMSLPAHQSLHEKRIIALVRALLPSPRIIVYSSCFDDVASPQLKLFSQLTSDFHATCNDRISLYLSSTAEMAANLNVDKIIFVHEPAETVSRIT